MFPCELRVTHTMGTQIFQIESKCGKYVKGKKEEEDENIVCDFSEFTVVEYFLLERIRCTVVE